jgi:hypothetical protein
MMIGLLGVERNAREKAERLTEVLELEAPRQRLAILLHCPSF